jgi:apolipoprotein N-acyltransferase
MSEVRTRPRYSEQVKPKIGSRVLILIQGLIGLSGIYFAIVFISAIIFSFTEKKSIFDSFWWSCVTAMTVGYGDIYPVTFIGRILAIMLMHFVPLFIIPLVTARMASRLIVNHDAFTHNEQEYLKESNARLLNDNIEIKATLAQVLAENAEIKLMITKLIEGNNYGQA